MVLRPGIFFLGEGIVITESVNDSRRIKCQFSLILTIRYVRFGPLTTFNQPGTTVATLEGRDTNLHTKPPRSIGRMICLMTL